MYISNHIYHFRQPIYIIYIYKYIIYTHIVRETAKRDGLHLGDGQLYSIYYLLTTDTCVTTIIII